MADTPDNSEQLTNHDEETHPRRYRVVRRRRVVTVRTPPRPRRVVAVQETVSQPTALLGVGLRISGIALDGTKLSLEDIENPVMGGIGVHFRSKLSRRWGLELSFDYLRRDDDASLYVQETMPLMLSAMFHVFPDSPIDLYALAGAGVHFTNLSYLDGLFEHHALEIAGQLGAGVQVRFGDHFAIYADVRFISVYKNLDTTNQVADACLTSRAGATGYCTGLNSLDPQDKWNIGAQFQAGATYYF
jgi:opacity protein-like surface antigen